MHYAKDRIRLPETARVRYLTDGNRSEFIVRAFATGLLSAFGHDPAIAIVDFEGEAVVNPDALEDSSLRIVVHAASLLVTNDISDKDRDEISRRMQNEVLESHSYPEIVYECSKASARKTGDGQYSMALDGELSLHGVTRSQPVSARVTLAGDSLRAAGEFSVRQSDYEIRLVSAAGGAVKLKDELKLSFDISARRQV